jgi:hypothetical protein
MRSSVAHRRSAADGGTTECRSPAVTRCRQRTLAPGWRSAGGPGAGLGERDGTRDDALEPDAGAGSSWKDGTLLRPLPVVAR